MKKHINITIMGRVHGVGFRFSCMEAAYRIGIKGIVRNKSNGSVYVEAEGEEDKLTKFREWCRKGPLWSKIYKIDEEDGELKNYKTFEIIK